MYKVKLGNITFPIAPSQIETRVSGNNETVEVLNQGEINMLKNPKLTEITMNDVLIPIVGTYPFEMPNADKVSVINKLETIMKAKKAVQLTIVRSGQQSQVSSGNKLVTVTASSSFKTNTKVTLESYTIKEDAEANGMDIAVDLELKVWKDYGVTTIKKKKYTSVYKKTKITRTKKAVKSPVTTKKGQTLKQIAKKAYGVGSENNALAIYKANKKVVNKALKKKFKKYTKRMLTTGLPKGLKIKIPVGWTNGKVVSAVSKK